MNLIGTNNTALLLGTSTTSFDTLLAGLGAGKMFRAPLGGTAAAANLAVAELRNPAASGKVLFLFGGDLAFAATQGFNVVVDGTTITPVGVPVPVLSGGAASVGLVGGSNQLAPTGTVLINRPASTSSPEWTFPAGFWFGLTAGHNIQWQGTAVNIVLNVNIGWLELTA